jgi:hypothetical protein
MSYTPEITMSIIKKSSLILKAGSNIGMNAAEADDDFLFSCFIRTPAYEELTRFESPKMIASGRTGAGKTAIIRSIQREHKKTVEIDPINISMEYIANSDILKFLHAVGADLDLMFQVIWKHALCVEYIRLRHDVKDETKWRKILENLQSFIGLDERKAAAVKYFRENNGRFWITIDENIKEVVEKITKKLETEFSNEFEKYKSKVHYEKGVSSEKRAEIIDRCKKIVTPEQLKSLASLIDVLADDEKHQGKHFIMIDRLDEQWVEDGLRFRMIRALIESLKGFRRITRLKIVVALRSDVLERVVQETQGLGFQKEKYNDYICDLRWTDVRLKTLIQQRLAHLAREKYTDQTLTWDEVFPRRISEKDAFTYMLERSLYRPRDMLAYVNLCLRDAEGKREVTASIVREVEREYSLGRLDALIDEWKGAFPSISAQLYYLANFEPSVTLEDLAKSAKLEDLALKIHDLASSERDPVVIAAKCYISSPDDAGRLEFVKAIVGVLYRIGAIGVRLDEGSRLMYSHLDIALVAGPVLTPASRVKVHLMLSSGLNLRVEHIGKKGRPLAA